MFLLFLCFGLFGGFPLGCYSGEGQIWTDGEMNRPRVHDVKEPKNP